MISSDVREGFDQVDQAADPSRYVRYLDGANAQDFILGYKRRSFAALGLGPGQRVLDLGCGTGEDVRAMAALVGPGGEAVGVDNSEQLVAEAERRSAGLALPGAFQVADAGTLPFETAAFDAARADRVLQHLPDRSRALAELVRVVRPGGRVMVADPDWDTLMVDHPDRDLTRRLVHLACDAVPNGWAGRQLVRLMRQAGLMELGLVTETMSFLDLPVAEAVLGLGTLVQRAVAAGALTDSDGAAWLAALRSEAEAGQFFAAVTGVGVVGTVPDGRMGALGSAGRG
jgi:ubiquinone/menaquinone biosynthesis C-methylase UbiE